MDSVGTRQGEVKAPATDPSEPQRGDATGGPAATAAGSSPGYVRQLDGQRAPYVPRLRVGGIVIERPTPRKPLSPAAATEPARRPAASSRVPAEPFAANSADFLENPRTPADGPNARANRKCAESLYEMGSFASSETAPEANGRAAVDVEPAERPETSRPARPLELEPDAGTPAEWARWLAAAWRACRHPSEWRPDASDAPQGDPGAPWTVLDVDGFSVEWVTEDAGEGVSPSLDTGGIGRQISANTRLSPTALWRAVQLAERTAGYRLTLAEHHQRIAAGLGLGEPGRAWHLARAKGWRERWGRVVQCGSSFALAAQCNPCGGVDKSDDRPITCDTRECGQCRSEHLRQLRARLLDLCALVEESRAFECADTHNGPGAPLGQWRWRFVTLTIPTGRGVGADAAQVRDAWAWVWRKWCEHVRKEGKERRAPFAWSSVEATIGENRDGHVHLHALVLGPYMAEALMRRWWGEALAAGRDMPYRDGGEVADFCAAGAFGNIIAPLAVMTRRGRAGRFMDRVAWPVTKVQAVTSLGDAVREVAKYAVKDGWDDYREDAELAKLADLYCALARVRLYSCSRWVAPLVPEAPPFRHEVTCERCGVTGEWTPLIRPRGPPGSTPRGYRCEPVTAAAMSAPLCPPC